ncbi:transposase [Enterococcus faecium]|uniref:transposase n=1 Tax=Enterococcus faecium TaxID=1352 RepID=UPI003F7B1054
MRIIDDGIRRRLSIYRTRNFHNQLKSTNLIERLNQRSTQKKEYSHLPQSNISQSLIGAVLMDLHDEWIYSSRKYINLIIEKW